MNVGQVVRLSFVHAEVDKPLSPEQEALSVMMSHFIEDSLYYGLFYHRWIHPAVRLPCPVAMQCPRCYSAPTTYQLH